MDPVDIKKEASTGEDGKPPVTSAGSMDPVMDMKKEAGTGEEGQPPVTSAGGLASGFTISGPTGQREDLADWIHGFNTGRRCFNIHYI